MEYPMNFISATKEYCTFEKYVSAPYIRKSFEVKKKITKADIIICGLGFYDLSINGKRITKGELAPYISVPNDVIYYDTYSLSKYLMPGENVIGILLGNGFQNCFGGFIWKFDKAVWTGAPKVALKLCIQYEDGETAEILSDESFLTYPSPILFDDIRCGEIYDGRNELPGWDKPGFDDALWRNCIKAQIPSGEPNLCLAEPIVVIDEFKPVAIIPQNDGFLYDFGVNYAGVCRLCIQGAPGQTVTMEYGEILEDGKFTQKNIQFRPDQYVQKDIYICNGNTAETYTPRFTYHGFRYVFVKGVTSEQANEGLLTYLVMNSKLEERGGFYCSDKTINTLQTLTRRSTLANFYYFPTDCPHREKNGWTGDAALSAEHTLLNLGPENSYREWLRNIRKAQNDDGAIPGIVPTAGWGFHWGNGPAWDAVLTYLPYYTYLYRGDTEILKENSTAIFRYLHYLSGKVKQNGLIGFGLGDWCPPGRKMDEYQAPLELTDSVISLDICKKAAHIFDVLKLTLQKEFAMGLYQKLLDSVRNQLIDHESCTAAGNCQTSQAMAIYYDVFTEDEKEKAFQKLLSLISEKNGHMDTGILGARVIFHVLSDFDRSDLAFDMITTPEYPSYGNWVARGATSLWEDFQPEGSAAASQNHHFFGDISGWFICNLSGIRLNPDGHNVDVVQIIPSFVESLNYVSGFHIAPAGKIEVEWKRSDGQIYLNVSVPKNIEGQIKMRTGYAFEDGTNVKVAVSGRYQIVKL